MIELIINIAPEKELLVKLLVEELGGEVIEKKGAGKKIAKEKPVPGKLKKNKKPSPTFLFGKWKDFDIDARKLREESWGRKF